MGGKRTKTDPSLGRSLIKNRFRNNRNKKKVDGDSMLHTTEIQDGYDWGRLNLQSVTEESSFQDFLRTAELAGTEFKAEKLNIKFINQKGTAGLLSTDQRKVLEQTHIDKKKLLTIPRRPKWTEKTTKEELKKLENESFLEWRRALAELQETEANAFGDTLLLTPYEKNLEFWRQLWRVIERSNIVVQIVDARNPLLFRSEDLEKYVCEINENKINMILINKADYLTEEQRKIWVDYFNKQYIKIAFFSAITEKTTVKIDEENEVIENEFNPVDDDDDDEEDDDLGEDEGLNKKKEGKTVDKIDEFSEVIKKENIKHAATELSKSNDKIEQQILAIENKLKICKSKYKNLMNSPDVLTRSELIQLFRDVYATLGKDSFNIDDSGSESLSVTKSKREEEEEEEEENKQPILTIGLVGYPNVGKSSTINALMIEKKVPVSATPGKTKHFQTLYLDDDLMLCDCPGLVMPSFVFSKSDMILNGILPIDQMRDHISPVNALCTEIPRHILEDKYGMLIAKPLEREDPNRSPYAEELLLAYGYNRGFMTANGQPDQARSARFILKDYVTGKLLYCHAPPNVNQLDFHQYPERQRPEISENKLPAQQQRAMHIHTNQTTAELDKNFFATRQNTVHIKGKTFYHIRGITEINEGPAASTTVQSPSSSTFNIAASQQSLLYSEKPWKHQKKERKEKLRKKFAHLDQQ